MITAQVAESKAVFQSRLRKFCEDERRRIDEERGST